MEGKSIVRVSGHHHACGCEGHHHQNAAPSSRSSLLGALLPVLACAVCPTCLGVWAQVLSAAFTGVVVTEAEHHALLVAAIAVTLVIAGYRFLRARHLGPLLLSLVACGGLAASHVGAESHLLSWISIAALIVASVWQHRARAHAPGREQPASRSAQKEYSS